MDTDILNRIYQDVIQEIEPKDSVMEYTPEDLKKYDEIKASMAAFEAKYPGKFFVWDIPREW